MKSINDLLTPCLILDEDKFSKNIRRIKSLLEKKKYNFIPHLKTAKYREITLEIVKKASVKKNIKAINIKGLIPMILVLFNLDV